LEELRQTDLSLLAALRRRVPDWSPEADLARFRRDAILAGLLDYERIAEAALGSEWGRLTEGQRRSFLSRFSALTNRAFVAALTRSNARIRFESESISGATARVLTTATADGSGSGSEPQIEYRLALKHGRWLVYDVLVDDVSLVDGYRSQLSALMRRGGFDEVMDRMARKLDETGP
jgi:phospholipid transport system substrate-binding protein